MSGEYVDTSFAELIARRSLEIGDGYRAKLEELGGNGPIFLRAGHVSDTHIDFTGVDRFRSDLADAVASKMSCPGDVVITTKGNSTGRVAFVTSDMPAFVYSPHLSYWRSLDHSVLVPEFLRYWSRSNEFLRQLRGMSASTDMAPYLSLIDQRRLRIRVPSSQSQRRIAEVLGGLDEKIDLNRRMNETLDAMAREIFKSWFIHVDPLLVGATEFVQSDLGRIPNGWNMVELGQIAEIIDCLHSKKPARQQAGKPLLQLWNIRDDSLLDMTDTYFISDEDYEQWISRMEAQEGDCVVTNVGRVAATAQIPTGIRAALGRNMTGIRCRPQFPFPTFLVQVLTSEAMREEINSKVDSGTILDSLNVRSIPHLRLVLPPNDILAKFEVICRPLRALMELNIDESRMLAAVRDELLPKLMSGKIRIKDAESTVEAGV